MTLAGLDGSAPGDGGAEGIVSVVIPTLRRPQIVLRAIRSVLAQTYRRVEVIVVVDGPDPETEEALNALPDTRVRVLVNARSLGAGGARNAGAMASSGEWIAFLDDDDEWLPTKLERQVALAVTNEGALISCLSRVQTPVAVYVWPRMIYDNVTPLDEYLFDRHSLFRGAAFLQTSTYLLPRQLFSVARFKASDQTPHEDWDFVLRLSKQHDARIVTVPDVLAVYHTEEPRDSLGASGEWGASLEWIDSISQLITPKAYSGFCLTIVAPRAASAGAYSAFLPLLVRACRSGVPTVMQLLVFLGVWVLPQGLRRQLRAARYRALRR